MALGALRRKLTLYLAAGLVAGTGALVGAPLHALAASTLTLTAASTTAAAGQTVNLKATATPTPAPGYSIYIYEATTQDVVGNDGCFDINPCVRAASYPTTSTHTFRAVLYDNAGTSVTSNPVSVTWTGNATYTVTLGASTTQAQGGQAVTLSASASPNVPTGYFLDIYEVETRTLVASCYGQSTCSGDATHNTGTYTYHAFIDNDPNDEYPPTGVVGASTTVQVTWTLPSALFCQPATVPLLGASVIGFNVQLSAKVGASQTAVCYRVDNGGSTAVGGAVVIKTSVPGLPHIVVGNLCDGAAGNTALGVQHPLADVSVLGLRSYLDVYQGPAAGNDTWVCTGAGTTFETVVIPSLSGLPSVEFVRDPDSLV
jgi:hypothetical protein